MKSALLRNCLAAHTWVGLAAGLALFIAFYTGALTVFTHELHAWEGKPRITHSQADARRLAQPLIDAVLAQHPQAAADFYLHLPDRYQPMLQLDWYESLGNGKTRDHHFTLSATGQLLEFEPRSEFVDFIYLLHYTAGLPHSWGLYALGMVCVLYGVALVTGVLIYAPNFFADLFAFRWGKNLKRLWQDAHNVVGILSLPFHVIFAWSGAVLALGTLLLAPFQFWVFDGSLLKLIGPDLELSSATATSTTAPLLPASRLMELAEKQLPDMEITRLHYAHAGDRGALADVYGEIEQRRLTRSAGVALNAASGELVRMMEPVNLSPGARFLRSLQSLHFGDFGRVTVKWLYFILGLCGAFLFYSGNLLWIEVRRRRRVRAQPRSGILVAKLTIGVCLGCIAGVSVLFLANKLLPDMAERPLWEERSYYLCFGLCMLWALLRPTARAAYELLLLSAVLTLAIPLANAFTTGHHLLRTLQDGQWAIFCVDASALVFAWAFWRLARATLHRARHGDANSVWALPAAGS